MKTKILFFFLLLVPLLCNAQVSCRISGSVSDFSGRVIAGASVLIKENERQMHLSTDVQGRFVVEVNATFVVVEIEHPGYFKKTFEGEVIQDQSIEFILEGADIALKEVVIANGSKRLIKESFGDKLSFSPKSLSNLPTISGTTDVVKTLQLTPGVQNSGDANGYLYVRGGDPGQNLMLYAGAPVYGMSHLLGIFPFYNADHISEVQFDKSNSNAKYGGRLSSTMSVIPESKVADKAFVLGNVGLLASQLTVGAPISSNSGLLFSVRKTYVDEIVAPLFHKPQKEIDGKNNVVDDTKYSFSDCNLTFTKDFSVKSKFKIDAFLSGDKFSNVDSGMDLNLKLKWGNSLVVPSWRYETSKGITLESAVYFSHYHNSLELSQSQLIMNVTSKIQDIGMNGSLRFVYKSIPVESGIQMSFLDLKPQKIESSGVDYLTTDRNSENVNATSLSLYTVVKPKLSPVVDADFGLRINHYAPINVKADSRVNIEPKLSFFYHPKENLSFYFTYALQNQRLNLITSSTIGIPSDFWITATSKIPSQSCQGFSFGGNKKILGKYDFLLGFYHKEMRQLVEYPYGLTQFNETSGISDDIRIGSGRSFGLESMFRKEIGRLKGWVSYTLSRSERKFDEINAGNVFFAKYDRRHNFSLVMSYGLNRKWDFGFVQIFSSGSRFTAPTSWYFINNTPVKEYGEYNNAQLPNYIRSDVSANYWFRRGKKSESALNFSVFNVMNISNPIYVLLKIIPKNEGEYVIVKTDNKTLYGILPSISWRFKF